MLLSLPGGAVGILTFPLAVELFRLENIVEIVKSQVLTGLRKTPRLRGPQRCFLHRIRTLCSSCRAGNCSKKLRQ